MKKLFLSSFLFIGLGFMSFGQNASVPGDDSQCQPGGAANKYCLYWDITYEVSTGFWPWSSATVKITCQTGGVFTC